MDEIAYIGRANAIVRELQAQDAPIDAATADAITRVVLRFGPYCIDSDVAGDPISYADGRVTLQLGLVPGLEQGVYTARMTVYDAANPEGLAWGEFRVRVLPWEACV